MAKMLVEDGAGGDADDHDDTYAGGDDDGGDDDHGDGDGDDFDDGDDDECADDADDDDACGDDGDEDDDDDDDDYDGDDDDGDDDDGRMDGCMLQPLFSNPIPPSSISNRSHHPQTVSSAALKPFPLFRLLGLHIKNKSSDTQHRVWI